MRAWTPAACTWWRTRRRAWTPRSPAATGRCTPFPPTPRCWSCATCWRPGVRCGGTGDDGRVRLRRRTGGRAMSTTVWHDVECGGYTADLGLWRELAAQEAGPVLD